MDLINQALKELNKAFLDLSTEEILRKKAVIQKHVNLYNANRNQNRKTKISTTLVYKA